MTASLGKGSGTRSPLIGARVFDVHQRFDLSVEEAFEVFRCHPEERSDEGSALSADRGRSFASLRTTVGRAKE